MTPRSIGGRAIGAFLGGTFAGAVLQFALYTFAARYLLPESYGWFVTAAAIGVLVTPLFDLGMSTSLVWVMSREPEAAARRFGEFLIWRFILLVPVGAVAVAGARWGGVPVEACALVLPMYLAAWADGVGTLGSAAHQGRQELSVAALQLLVRHVARVLALGITAAFVGDAADLAWLTCGCCVVAAGWNLSTTLRRVPVEWRLRPSRSALLVALPFGLAIVANVLRLQLDVPMLAALAGGEEAGVYHAGIRFLLVSQVVAQAVSTATAPVAYRGGLIGRERVSEVYRLVTVGVGTIGLMVALTLALLGDQLALWVFGDAFSMSVPIVLATAPIVWLKFLSMPLADAMTGLGHQQSLVRCRWTALLVNVVGNLVLIPIAGAMGAVVAAVISEIVTFGWLVSVTTRCGLETGWTRVLRHPALAAAAAGGSYGCTSGLDGAAWIALAAGALGYVLACAFDRVEEERLVLRGASGS